MNQAQMQLPNGNWMEAIPLAYRVGLWLKKHRCHCGRTFKTDEDYSAHYVYAHILGLSVAAVETPKETQQ